MAAHNEELYLKEAVTSVVDGLRARGESFEVVVCENGSTDATEAIAARLSADVPEVRHLHLERADYGLALRAGFLSATGDLVANFDVDMVDLDFLAEAVPLARAGAAVVVGAKRGPGSDDRRSAGRRVVTAVFSVVLKVGFGLGVHETHGIKVLRRDDAVRRLVEECEFGGDIFDTELIIRVERAGLQVRELPVTVVERRPPRTPIARRVPRSLIGLARLRLALWRRPSSRSAIPRRRRRPARPGR